VGKQPVHPITGPQLSRRETALEPHTGPSLAWPFHKTRILARQTGITLATVEPAVVNCADLPCVGRLRAVWIDP